MIDSRVETLIPFAEVVKAFPGRDKISMATLHKWRHIGVRGCKLETLLVGGLRYSSAEAIQRFIEAQNMTDSTPTPKREKPGRPKIHVDAIKVGVIIPPDLLTLLDTEAGDGSRQAAILRILRKGLESNGG
jgi:hypothetical protein